jgi:transcription elongation GreA/GreB family factor
MDWNQKSTEALDQWFLDSLSREPLPVPELFSAMDFVVAAGDQVRVVEWSEFLIDTLLPQGKTSVILDVLERRCRVTGDDGTRARAAEVIAKAIPGRLGQLIVKGAGFDKGLPLTECLRRVRLLSELQPGRMCHDKTWGFGVVGKVDEFYEKVVVDFTRKAAHAFSFSYAAETLELLDESHLLARWHRNPAEIREMIATRPDELVRMALRSYGPRPVALLQEILTESIVPAETWKTFWDAARKALKSDPLVEIPAKRSEDVRLLAGAKEFGDAWVEQLAAERDPAEILRALEAAGPQNIAALGDVSAIRLRERVAFALWACGRKEAALLARLLMTADALGYKGEMGSSVTGADGARREVRIDPAQLAESFLTPAFLIGSLESLPARDAPRFMEFLGARLGDRLADVLVRILADLDDPVLDLAVPFLAARGRETDVVSYFSTFLSALNVRGEQVYWLGKDPEAIERWSALRPGDVAMRAVDWINVGESEGRRIHKQVRGLFGDKKWLAAVTAGMNEQDRWMLFHHVERCIPWDVTEKRSVMAALIKMYPELEAAAAKISHKKGESGPARMTSWRTYNERQASLKELVEKTIPANAQDIAHARSYGDLRENFEYQTARDRHRLLLRRKAEIEVDLGAVRGTDFKGVPADVAGMGTMVTVRRPDGGLVAYCVLGEWDRDEALNIISNRSRIAEALQGHRAGDVVTLPGADGDVAVTIETVSGLDEAVRRWVGGA